MEVHIRWHVPWKIPTCCHRRGRIRKQGHAPSHAKRCCYTGSSITCTPFPRACFLFISYPIFLFFVLNYKVGWRRHTTPWCHQPSRVKTSLRWVGLTPIRLEPVRVTDQMVWFMSNRTGMVRFIPIWFMGQVSLVNLPWQIASWVYNFNWLKLNWISFFIQTVKFVTLMKTQTENPIKIDLGKNVWRDSVIYQSNFEP